MKELIQHWIHFQCLTKDDHGINLTLIHKCFENWAMYRLKKAKFSEMTTRFQVSFNTLLKEKKQRPEAD